MRVPYFSEFYARFNPSKVEILDEGAIMFQAGRVVLNSGHMHRAKSRAELPP